MRDLIWSWIKSPDFPMWQAVGAMIGFVDGMLRSRVFRIGAASIRYNLWRRRLGRLGKGTIIYPNVVIHSPERVEIGENVSIAEFVQMWGGGGIYIGDHVMIAVHAVITSVTHGTRVDERRINIMRPVRIRDNAWIGSGAIVLPGVTIGRNAVVGAGAVVTGDVPDNVVVVGVPARVARQLEFKSPIRSADLLGSLDAK